MSHWLGAPGVTAEHGFIPFGLVGPFAFGLTGKVANPLADAGVSIVALSSFDTDHVRVEAARRANAIAAPSGALGFGG
jgi:hypothetical protein